MGAGDCWGLLGAAGGCWPLASACSLQLVSPVANCTDFSLLVLVIVLATIPIPWPLKKKESQMFRDQHCGAASWTAE